MANVKLKRLKIEKYRNVAPGTELVFNDGFNVLLGQNGTGKTTLLRLIATVLASDFAGLESEEFALEYDLALSEIDVALSIRNEQQADATEDPDGIARTLSWSYAVSVKVKDANAAFSLTVTPTGTARDADEPVAVQAILPPFRSPFNDLFLILLIRDELLRFEKDLGVAWRQRALGDLFTARIGGRFDESLGGFDAMIGGGLRDRENEDRIVSFLFSPKRSKDGSILGGTQLGVPSQVMEKIKSEPSILDQESPKISHLELDFLQKFTRLAQIQEAYMILRLTSKSTSSAGTENYLFGEVTYSFGLNDGSVFKESALSYGQKRLLSFLYHMSLNSHVVIADELVNGMHYDWIEACLREIGDRQSFLTSQNPLLLDFLPFATEQDVEHTFILCGNEPREGHRYMVWKNMPEESAQTFFRSYKTQALQVSEILRSRGWW